MAKFTKIFTTTTETSILEFRGESYRFEMKAQKDGGMLSHEHSLCEQVSRAYSEDDDADEIEGLIEAIQFEFDDMQMLLDQLEGYEYGY